MLNLGKTPIARTKNLLYVYTMKAIILLSAIILASCSKSKDAVEPETINLTAAVTKERPANTDYYWKVTVNMSKQVTASGSVTVEWDEYSANTLISHKTHSFSFSGANSGSHSMVTANITNFNYTAKNIKITAAAIAGYQVKY